MKKSYHYILLICMIANFKMLAQIMPNLGSAADYGILSGANFYAQDTVTIKGKIGGLTGNLNISNASARVNGSNSLLITALTDLTNAKSTLSSQAGTAISNTITNQSFNPGVYTVSGNAFVTGSLNLLGDSNSVFIFNINGDLLFDDTYINMVANTVFASKVFWNVSGEVNIKGNNHILGNILSQKKIQVSMFYAGFVSLLSQDSIIINNPGVASYHLLDKKSIFYSANKIVSYQNPSKTTNDCLTSALTCGNMISNPSFEDFTTTNVCPSTDNEIDLSCDWYKLWTMNVGPVGCCYDHNFAQILFGNAASKSADFFSTCGSGDYYLPYNYYTGYTAGQIANTGNNCAGIKTQFEYGWLGSDVSPNPLNPLQYGTNFADNALRKKMPAPLTPSKVYYLEFYANLANISNRSAKIAVYPMWNANPPFDRPQYYVPGVGNPTPLFTSNNPIPDDSNWHKVSGCFSVSDNDVEYIAIKSYIDDALPAGGVVPATTYAPSNFISPPLSGIASGIFGTVYFLLDDVMMKPLANAGADQNVNCNNSAFIGENCSPIQGAVYSWAPADAFTSSNSIITNPNSIYSNVNFNVTGTYVYNLTVTLNNCSSTDQVVVNVVYGAPAGITMVTNGCNGTVLSVTNPVPGAVYTWQPGGLVGTSITVSPTQPTVYTLIASYGTCDNKETVTVSPYLDIKPCVNEHTNGTSITVLPGVPFILSGSYTNYNFTCYESVFIPASAGVNLVNCTFMMAPNTKITMSNKSNARVLNCHFYGCNGMWDGIYMPGQIGAELNIRNSVIEDALIGIRVAAAGSTGVQNFPNELSVDNCLFNTNHVDIDYANTNTNTLSVSKTAFTSRCLNYDPPSIPLPVINGNFYTTVLANAPFMQPLSGIPAPLYGIYMYEYLNLPGQGNQINLQTVNIFDRHAIGIRTLNFNNLKIEKQIFVNGMTAGKEMPTVSNIGILLSNSDFTPTTTSPNNNFLITIGNSGNKGNTFYNLDYGIYANAPNHSIIRTTVRYNSFNSIRKSGIYYIDVPYNGPTVFVGAHNLGYNNFYDCKNTAITVINSKKTGMRINNNTISNPINLGVEYKGIAISEISNPATAKYVINDNILSNVNKGIRADNVYNPVININTIDLVPTSFGFLNFGQGIILKNCASPTVNRNNLTGLYSGAGSSIDMGLSVADCPKGYYSCNVIKNTLFGGAYNGQNIGTTIRQNTFDNHGAAIYLVNNGVIDIQGNSSPTGAADNQFFNINAGQYHTYAALSTIGSNSQFFVRNNLNFAMPNNLADGTSIQVLVANILSPVSYVDECTISNNSLQNGNGLSPLANVVANPGLFNTSLIRENHTSKRQLYKELLTMSSVPNATLQTFKSTESTTSLGRFTMVDSTISEYFEGNSAALTQAQNYNSLVPLNNVESYQKQFNDLYLQFLQNNSLNASDIIQLNTIAALCPYTDGTVVWQARAFAKLFNDTLEFENICEAISPLGSSTNSSRVGFNKNEYLNTTTAISSKLIPNPNDGNFTLLMDKEVQDLSLIVYDVTGKEVCSNSTSNTNNIQLNCTDLKNGIYFVKVFSNSVYLQSHKLVIQK